ncbi:hypothetical protein DPMN_069899 [Dreissena polymorpha]|uniref:Uncharacterized protein n=1 Tax=Dreissena polymorpha TaxID=45954 RepID=A0A9D4BVA2_DREPO|nr:hypothetical protein DPMN_069899 [Dreissena polymorpha]
MRGQLDGLVVRDVRMTRWLGRAWRKDDFPARSLVVRFGQRLDAGTKDFCETKLLSRRLDAGTKDFCETKLLSRRLDAGTKDFSETKLLSDWEH